MREQPDYREYIEAWRARWRDRDAQLERWKEEGRAEARRLARKLAEEYGAEEVYLFGSLALPWTPHHKPDIDLAVRGLSMESHFPAWTRLEEQTTFEVDVVRLEEANERLLKAVAKEGELLWDAARSQSNGT